RFTNEDHLAVHKHKHEMTLKFGPARTDSVIIADQTPTPTRFLKNCEEVGLFNELASSFEHEFKKAAEDDEKKEITPKPVIISTPTPTPVRFDAYSHHRASGLAAAAPGLRPAAPHAAVPDLGHHAGSSFQQTAG
ncbi:PREDICTED: cyclic AMP-dependent transcription factor ATF-7-like, partial [Chlamydotis macqueenii]|uniref:cyclic AMP-dependent transcription factor ATF-7-like n=1 Tax=Chlamydotis macqueenii TaxID=187382 RepID=UPI000529603B